MKPWGQRPHEEEHLLNPAFCCLCIVAACAGYRESADRDLPFVLSFMILPIVLHKSTRESLPRTPRTSMPSWIQAHPEARLGFFERLIALRPHTREALSFGMVSDWVSITNQGEIESASGSTSLARAPRFLSGDAHECVSRSRVLGKWLATVTSTETTMALWGLRP